MLTTPVLSDLHHLSWIKKTDRETFFLFFSICQSFSQPLLNSFSLAKKHLITWGKLECITEIKMTEMSEHTVQDKMLGLSMCQCAVCTFLLSGKGHIKSPNPKTWKDPMLTSQHIWPRVCYRAGRGERGGDSQWHCFCGWPTKLSTVLRISPLWHCWIVLRGCGFMYVSWKATCQSCTPNTFVLHASNIF